MAAVVFAFKSHKPEPQRPWQNHELAELYRAVEILGRAGLPVVTDMGMSDEGDPWFVFCREDTGDVIVHCARINGLFVASSIAVEGTFRGANFREVIERIVRHEPLQLPIATSSSRVFLHPMMVLAAFVATALLYSKKADAHDLHSAVMALTPHDAHPGQKGAAAIKAALNDFFAPFSHGREAARAASAEIAASAAIPLAAIAGAAVAMISSSVDASSLPQTTFDAGHTATVESAVFVPPQIRSSILFGTSSAPALQASESAHAAKGLADWDVSAAFGKVADLKIVADTAVISSGPSVSLPVDASLPAQPLRANSTLGAPTFDHQVLTAPAEHNVITSSASPTTTDTHNSTAAQQMAFVHFAGDIGDVSSVALAVLTGSTLAQPKASDALILLANSSVDRSDLSQAPPLTVVATTATTVASKTEGVADLSHQQDAAPVETPTQIVMGIDPTAGLAALTAYAASQHAVSGALTPSALLTTAIATYTAEIAHGARLVVFDSNAIALPVFEFSKGVLFVDDHDLGIDLSQVPGNATTVFLGSGGTMTLLGVVDTAQLHLPI